MTEYRNELKFICSEQSMILLEKRIAYLLEQDKNNEHNSYNVRSIYFDDFKDECLDENLSGIDEREKFRIRIYNGNSNIIKLELKSKKHGMTNKKSVLISKEEFNALMVGEVSKLIFETDKPLVRKICMKIQTEFFTPKIIVQYDRTAYICDEGNARITFDRNITSSDDYDNFFNDYIFSQPAMEPHKHLLEVKYDEFLPGYISDVLQTNHMSRVSFSKYYICRMSSLEERYV